MVPPGGAQAPGSGPISGPVYTAPPAHAPGQVGAAPLAPGMSLQDGRYVIDRALGKGGMGSVFLAHDTHVNNKPVVIKEMANVYATEEERREAEAEFQAEMQTLAALSHPNIPQISDFFTESNRHFAVQEYVTGQDLQKAIDTAQQPGQPPQGLPEKQVLGWTSQVLSVLDYLEQQNPQVIHRDIKPANIVVDANNRVRVVDFGIASHKFRPGSHPSAGQQVSTALGTPGYAPKEQFTGQETPLSDIYALGATMHHLLTGRDPTKVQPLWQYPPVRALSPRVSEATERIVARALENDPAKRWQSAAEMKKAVDRVLNPPGALNTFRGRAIALVVVLLLLAGGVGAAYFYSQYQAGQIEHGYVSTGNVAFDLDPSGRTQTASNIKDWINAKKQASIDFKNNRLDSAAAGYSAATNNDQTDAESWIYQENIQALQAGNPYYIAVGASFSGASVFGGREFLQGAYTAQKEINQRGGINGHQIVLVLANDGSTSDGATQSARKIAGYGKVLALVGYRSSSRTALAIPILEQARIPMVSPTASNPNLSSPYFFRVCPSDTYQGTQAAQYMLHELLNGKSNPLIAIISDPNDKYSNGIAGIVSAVAGSQGARLLQETYVTGQTTDFSAQAKDVVAQHADIVYFAGLAHEALLFAKALDAPSLHAPADLKIMSDDGFYNPSEFIAQPGHKQRFYFTGFFYPDEASLIPDPTIKAIITKMETDYKTNFHKASLPYGGYGSDRVPSGTALAYDALEVVAQAIQRAGSNPTSQSVRDAIAAIGTSTPAYQGVTGRIAFDANGNPVDKALLVMRLDPQGRTHMVKFLGTVK